MRIDIHRPELEAIINERLQSGAYENAEDLIWQALRSSVPPAAPANVSKHRSLIDVFQPVRGVLTDDEIETVFSRNPSTGRPVDVE